jgi:hypothetical protein
MDEPCRAYLMKGEIETGNDKHQRNFILIYFAAMWCRCACCQKGTVMDSASTLTDSKNVELAKRKGE